uniref:EamA domain-containing protein n=1 Tax=Magnetococcus massalia (strain MO-1) TaxID=451514 RepID=A0A1S7LL19_MAGMO|nr:conserved membrane protein of unknown function [Candidatus Magnetococcus massalia]
MDPIWWLPLAICTALFTAFKDLLGKRSVAKKDPWAVASAMHLIAFLVLLPLLPFMQRPAIGSDFWWALLGSGSINVAAMILYLKALQAADLSLTTPMLTTTPLFLLVTSPIIVGETPSAMGLIGVVLIFLGAYLLNISQRHLGFWAPFKALWDHKGPRYMLLVAFMFSISSNLDKVGILNSSPLFWLFCLFAFISAGTLTLALYHGHSPREVLVDEPLSLSLQGVLFSAAALSQFFAIQLTMVPYVIAIKRTSALIAVGLGIWLLKESGGRERITGALVMFGGFLFITFAGQSG